MLMFILIQTWSVTCSSLNCSPVLPSVDLFDKSKNKKQLISPITVDAIDSI